LKISASTLKEKKTNHFKQTVRAQPVLTKIRRFGEVATPKIHQKSVAALLVNSLWSFEGGKTDT
jgi:hypothetical protein